MATLSEAQQIIAERVGRNSWEESLFLLDSHLEAAKFSSSENNMAIGSSVSDKAWITAGALPSAAHALGKEFSPYPTWGDDFNIAESS